MNNFSGATEYTRCIEVPSIGIFSLDLTVAEHRLTLYPWRACDKEIQEIETILGEEIRVMPMATPDCLMRQESHLDLNFETLLRGDVPSMDANAIFSLLLENDKVKLCIETLTTIMHRSVEHRVQTTKYCCHNVQEDSCPQTSLGILFSGGIDCTILAILADRFLDEQIPIDLINVSFEKVTRESHSRNAQAKTSTNYDTPDRKTAKEALEELEKLCPAR